MTAPPGTETILLVEDEPAVRLLGREVLEMRGYTVLEGGNGRDALEISARHQGPIHLLLTDVVMPKMTGAELAHALLAARPGLRVLYMSGYAPNDIQLLGDFDRRARFLQKPFSLDVLAHAIRETLDA